MAGCRLPEESGAVKTHLAYMSQRFGLYPDLTVNENINFYADLYGVTRWSVKIVWTSCSIFSYMRLFASAWRATSRAA